jgi:hypothetical protein
MPSLKVDEGDRFDHHAPWATKPESEKDVLAQSQDKRKGGMKKGYQWSCGQQPHFV